ncbi:MAG: [FeFe] hydrogenase H-cluster radical SAM maturase HydE [Candidatus Portnoybacteria bacterium]|nr:[FeFe] hydrogenase H-cluster radical SAM maturase HydE [Candidatus Portnoybacteria bacterium]
MCLTIPKQIISVNKNIVKLVRPGSPRVENATSLVGVKKDDWVLCINDLILKRISPNDAREIIELLKPTKKIDIAKLDSKFKKIIQSSKTRKLSKKEIIYLLKTSGSEKKALLSEANIVRQEHIKDFICIHGIIEFSNFCKNDCVYCGLRKENELLPRYRMSVDEIVKTAEKAVKERGYKLLVLQSGEDYFYTDNMLVEIIKKIKAACRVFIFVSIGERSYAAYKKIKDAGASGVLFRFETSNPELFKKLHPRGKNLNNRFKHLKFMKGLGYFVATGSLIGLPGQTIEDLADDIIITQNWTHMVSMGPFVPCDNTQFTKKPHGDPEMNLKMIAILRLLMPEARIPVTTAFETLAGENGRKQALASGANSLMFNLTPAKYRPLYQIYPDKFFKKEEMWEKYGLFKYEESYKMLEERIQQSLSSK